MLIFLSFAMENYFYICKFALLFLSEELAKKLQEFEQNAAEQAQTAISE